MKREEFITGSRFFAKKTQKIAAAVLFLLFLCPSVPVKAAWQDDANDRIEQFRKRNAQITVLGSGGSPVSDVSVDIQLVNHSFAFGTALNYGSTSGNTTYKNFVLSHFNFAVCENETKWPANEPTQDNETYTQSDYIYNFCHSNGIRMRGHCLFWEQTASVPTWVTSLNCTDMQTQMNQRIDHAVSHYASKFEHWDVDNEMLNNDFYGTCLGDPGRANLFIRAHSVDPNCLLFMNEYNGNSFGGYSATAYISRTDNLISLGAPVGGIGIQAHVGTVFDPQSYWNSVLKPLGTLGLPIWATEFDTDATDDTARATDVYNFYLICFSDPNVKGINMWGFMVGNTWRASGAWGIVSNTGTLNAAGVTYEALKSRWTTHDSNTTGSDGTVNSRGFFGTYQITLSKPGETTEVHTIQLDPNTTTAYFTIDTNFITNPNDFTPPTPDPMTWASNPAATGPSSITMTASTASDESGVEYSFVCTAGGGHNSGWQLSATYTDTNLSPNTQYTYQVQARDRSSNHNTTAFSDSRSATTQPPDTTPPTPNPMTWSSVPTATGAYTITMTASTATDITSPPVQYYFECTTDGAKSSGWQSSPTYLSSGLTPSTLYTFRVQARDSALTPNVTGWSSSLSATTLAAPVSILGSWVTNNTTHAAESGSNRALILIAHDESTSGNPYVSSVTYGGQAMTKIIEVNAVTSGGYGNYVAAFILNEAGIAAASGSTFTPAWSVTPGAAAYTSVFLANVNQTTLVGASAGAWTISGTDPISTSSLATNNRDMVILGATCNNLGSYTLGNGFTIGGSSYQFGDATTGGTGVAGYKAATGANETPSADYSDTLGRQCIVGFVVKAAVPADTAPAAPTGLVATAGNKSIILTWNSNSEPDMNGYNVYRSTTQGGGYAKLNISLLTNTNYTDNGLTNGTPYYYVVTAVDLTGHESTNSSEKTATPAYQTCADALAEGHRLSADLAGAGDCYVNFLDFVVLAGHWLDNTCTGPGNCDGADFEPNGSVDMFDLSEFADQWLTCNDPQNSYCTKNW